MSNKEEIKTFLDSLYKSENIVFLTYAVENTSTTNFFKMLNRLEYAIDDNRYPTQEIVKRLYLEKEKKSKELEENYSDLSNSYSVLIREFVVKNADISIILTMIDDSEEKVINAILDRLDSEKNSLTNNDYLDMTCANSEEIQKFIANNASLDTLLIISKDINEGILNHWGKEPTKILLERLVKAVTE